MELLLAEDRSAQALMDKTLGSANIIDSSNIPILLEEMRKAQIAEHTEETSKKIHSITKSAKERETELSKEIRGRDSVIHNLQSNNEQAHAKLESVYEAIVLRTNYAIKRRRRIFAGLIVLSYLVLIYLNGLETPKRILAVLGFLTVFVFSSLVFQFSSFVERRFVRPIFERADNLSLSKVASESGVQWEAFVSRVEYDGTEFVLIESD